MERRGAAAPGGGFAVIATPRRDGSTGIMTLMISHQGDVCQANPGSATTRPAAGTSGFGPGEAWQEVADDRPIR